MDIEYRASFEFVHGMVLLDALCLSGIMARKRPILGRWADSTRKFGFPLE